jgi:hypothetical protein
MKTIHTDYYGDSVRWFLGRAVNNKDPLKLGRIQVRIYGIHTENVSDIPTKDLPWAQVVIPSTEGGISGIGKMGKILNGAQVFGFFLDGPSSQIPLVVGSIHSIEVNGADTSKNTSSQTSSNSSVSNGLSQTPVKNYNENPSNPKSPYNSSGSPELMGGSNGEKIYNYFLANGLSPNQAAAVVGNFAAESSLKPDNLNPNDVGKPAYGLAQWRADRYSGLVDYCSSNNLDYKSLEGQLAYSMHELNTKSYLGLGALKSSSTLEEAVRVVETKYERPQPGTFDKRYAFARQALEKYSG